MVLVAVSVALTMAPSSWPAAGMRCSFSSLTCRAPISTRHLLDIAGDLAQLAVDRGVHRLEEALQRLRGDLGERDDVVERDVLALLLRRYSTMTVEMLLVGHSHGRLRPCSPLGAGLPHPCAVRCCLIVADGSSRRPSPHALHRYSANTASILVLSVWALNGLTM